MLYGQQPHSWSLVHTEIYHKDLYTFCILWHQSYRQAQSHNLCQFYIHLDFYILIYMGHQLDLVDTDIGRIREHLSIVLWDGIFDCHIH